MSNNKLAKAAGLIMILTIISKIMGFFRDALVANSFGATFETDAYNMAITIPEILFAIFSLAITTTFIPILSDCIKNKGKEEMFKFANNIINILLIISIILTIVGWIMAPELVRIIAPKFKGETYYLTITLIKISVINIIFMSLNGAYTAVLQTLDDFSSPALVGIMLNLPIIIYLLLGAQAGVIGLTIATVVGNALKMIIQIPWLYKNGYRYRLIVNPKDERIAKILLLILPVIVGAGANQLNAIINQSIGSGLPEGSISSLNYGGRITDMIYVSFASAIVTVVYPALSREGNSDNYDNFKFYITKAINTMSLIMIPCTVGLIVLSTPLITLLFKHGAFDDRAVSMTTAVLIAYSVGIPFYGVRDVFNRSLYALKDTKASTINGIIGIVVNIISNILIVKFLGVGGLALSTSIAAITTTFLLWKSLSNKIGKLKIKLMMNTTFKITAASIIMGIGTKITYVIISSFIKGIYGNIAGIISAFITSLLIYALALKLMKVNEFEDFLKEIMKKTRKRI